MEDETLKTVVIAPLPAEQWEPYRTLRLEALEREPHAFGSSLESMLEKPAEYWQSRLENAGCGSASHLLFAIKEGVLVGMIGSFQIEPGHAAVIAMYVTESERRKGIARKLMAAILERLAEDPLIQKISLGVNREQEAAARLYLSMGFEPVDITYDQLGDGKEHEVSLMVLKSPFQTQD